jgi:hypothetical protein
LNADYPSQGVNIPCLNTRKRPRQDAPGIVIGHIGDDKPGVLDLRDQTARIIGVVGDSGVGIGLADHVAEAVASRIGIGVFRGVEFPCNFIVGHSTR